MIQPLFNGMLAILLAKFCLNDLPHAAGLTEPSYDRPPTRAQLRYIAGLRQRLKMTITYEREVVTFGEAGRMIRELEAEEKDRKRLKGGNSSQYDKYIEVRARELSAKIGEPYEKTLEVLKLPIEVPHYRVLGWIVREEAGTITAEFGLATGITVEPGLPETLRNVYIAHEIGHGESICKKLQRGEPVSIGKEFECLAWQEGIPAARELGVLEEYFAHWRKEAAYLGCYPPSEVSNPNTATGTCYPDAWRYVMRHTEAEPVLVHGTTVTLTGRLGHAWVELPDGTVWEPASKAIFPIEKFYSLVDPIVEDRYTVDEAASMLNVGYHGPWNAEERMKHIGR